MGGALGGAVVACGSTQAASTSGVSSSSGSGSNHPSGSGSGSITSVAATSGSSVSGSSRAGSSVTSASGAASDAGAGSGDASTGQPPVDAGVADAGPPTCKRGIATNTAPGTAFNSHVHWWYNWSLAAGAATPGIEFVPMIWGASTVSGAIPSGSKFVLGFNEPNFHAQSNLTPQQAASDWSALETNARAAGVAIVSPAMNFCGPAAQCNGTDPYQYLKDFFAACSGCEVDYVAVHWYNCDLPSLQDYLEPGGSLEGFYQFGKPIWLTEFSCDTSATAAAQQAYMQAAVPYLEGNPHVYRYSWFSASPIPNAVLINSDGTPTALGQTYMGLAQTCP